MKKKTWICIILAAVAALIACFAYIHRRAIRSAIKGEELPPDADAPCCGETADAPEAGPEGETVPEAGEQ